MADGPTLESQLAEVRAGARERLPDLVKLIERLAEDLEKSKIAEALNAGDQAPDFTLRRAEDDEPVSLSDELTKGPAVLSFYRGGW